MLLLHDEEDKRENMTTYTCLAQCFTGIAPTVIYAARAMGGFTWSYRTMLALKNRLCETSAVSVIVMLI